MPTAMIGKVGQHFGQLLANLGCIVGLDESVPGPLDVGSFDADDCVTALIERVVLWNRLNKTHSTTTVASFRSR